ncbi:MAG: SDR family oxidoreductase [Actinomycetota bacterium]|nr:SDR family oxidoreductase [Actinomycetota bacterium]
MATARAIPPGRDAELSELERFARYPSLADRVVVITGGASGIGASLVAHFCAQGASVAFVDLAQAPARRLCQDLRAYGLPSPLALTADVRDVDALRAALGRAESELGSISVLVNNAANDRRVPSADMSVQDWDDAIATNLRPHFFATQAVAPTMRANGGGSIINLGSVSAHTNFVDLAGYIASKAGIEGLTRTLARELGPAGIRVNCVIPGWIMTERQREGLVTEEVLAALDAAQSLRLRLTPADVARLVLWLAADDSRGATGQRWVVDAGWM